MVLLVGLTFVILLHPRALDFLFMTMYLTYPPCFRNAFRTPHSSEHITREPLFGGLLSSTLSFLKSPSFFLSQTEYLGVMGQPVRVYAFFRLEKGSQNTLMSLTCSLRVDEV